MSKATDAIEKVELGALSTSGSCEKREYVVEVCECLSGRSKRLAKGHSVLGPRVIEKKRRGLKV